MLEYDDNHDDAPRFGRGAVQNNAIDDPVPALQLPSTIRQVSLTCQLLSIEYPYETVCGALTSRCNDAIDDPRWSCTGVAVAEYLPTGESYCGALTPRWIRTKLTTWITTNIHIIFIYTGFKTRCSFVQSQLWLFISLS
jgi:hypothetical protein